MLLRYNRLISNRIHRPLISKNAMPWLLLMAALGAAAAFSMPVLLNNFNSTRLSRGDALPHPTAVVCIDPGHPTLYSSGRRMLNGTTELDINWQVAQKLSKLLEDKYHIEVVETRKAKDRIMSNRARAGVANKAHAVLFVRLHCDAGPNHGFALYYPDRQGDDQGVKGPSPEVIKGSKEAAGIIHDGMADALDGRLKDRGVMGESRTKVGRKYGALTASVLSKAPSVTVEMVFLSNKYDARFIKSEKGQDAMTQALAKGIARYLESDQAHTTPS